jgi:hypothetical protein
VVGVAQAHEGGSPAVLPAALLPVLKRHLEGDLRRGRARVAVEDAAEARRRELDQAGRELGGRGMGEPEHGRVGDPIELLANRRVDQRMTVAVHVAPQ